MMWNFSLLQQGSLLLERDCLPSLNVKLLIKDRTTECYTALLTRIWSDKKKKENKIKVPEFFFLCQIQRHRSEHPDSVTHRQVLQVVDQMLLLTLCNTPRKCRFTRYAFFLSVKSAKGVSPCFLTCWVCSVWVDAVAPNAGSGIAR